MAITLTPAFLAELNKGSNQPRTILEAELDSGTEKWGVGMCGFSDVLAFLDSVGSLSSKINSKAGYSERGDITAVIKYRGNFKDLIANEYLKNRSTRIIQTSRD